MRQTTDIEKSDIATAEAAAPKRNEPWVRILGWISELADQPQLISITAATLGVGLLTRNGRLARAGAGMLAAELLATKLKSLVKNRVDRTRPSVIAEGRAYAFAAGDDEASDNNSFPSGHTAGAVAVARAFGRIYPEHRFIAYVGAAAVALIQIPRCKHYPSDLAAGALIGLAADGAVRGAEVSIAQAFAPRGADAER